MSKQINSFRELHVYQAAFSMGQSLFEVSKSWPRTEKYSLTDQLTRSSRSIGANIAEAWGKRRYPAHFVSKLTDAVAELQETEHWLDVALECGYLDADTHSRSRIHCRQIGRMLGSMIRKARSFTDSSTEP